MRNLALGLLIGLVVALSMPAGAHHSRLADRVKRLSQRVVELESFSDRHERKLQWVTTDGIYQATVFEDQVLSEVCQQGEAAFWTESEAYPGLRFLAC